MALVCLLGASPALAAKGDHPKLDRKLNERAKTAGRSRVIVRLLPGWDGSSAIEKVGGKFGRRLDLINGRVVDLPNGVLRRLADHPGVASIDWDRPTEGQLARAATTTGARAVRQQYGYNGAGIGVAVIDSGVTGWHNDLTVAFGTGQRVSAFVDFVGGRTSAYDDFGHGTHVAGIIAGNGRSSLGVQAGIAPAASIIGLKVLNGNGAGVISDVIAAIEWAVAHRLQHNIRVINLSVGASITSSYRTDPLALAAKHAVDVGMVVVAAAGNRGTDAYGQPQYASITAPGNAPWVLTVGASSTQGTVVRYDDTIAGFSSRGPSAVDNTAKPDLVAPGAGMVSLSDPNSLFYTTKSTSLLGGTLFGYKPYLSLSGTSMATPVVSGTVALMLQANPNLTPNLVKAILQYTAQEHAGYDALTQGAGFLNTKGAVDLARYFATAAAGQPYPTSKWWSKKIIWGNQRIAGGVVNPAANAWATNIVWGTLREADGDNIVWGTRCDEECDNIVWGTVFDDSDNIVWGTLFDDTDNIVWGTAFDDADNIVWGTLCGGDDCDNLVWGTGLLDDADNIVWGTSGADDEDNLVWGSSGDDADNIVWGTSGEECTGDACDNVVWGTSGLLSTLWGLITTAVEAAFESLFAPPATTTTTNTLLSGGGF